MKKFCKDLREHAMKVINFEEKEMIQLTTEENESYQNQKVCHICTKFQYLLYTIKYIVILLENKEELLMIFAT